MNNRKFPWILVAFALAFIFNPNIAIIDPLPDFIGYVLLTFALNRLSVLNETLGEAKIAFDKMIMVDLGKLFAIIFIFGIDAMSERTTSILLWCFVFAVLEGIFLIPAFIKLFKGISELGDFYPNSSIHSKVKNANRSYTERIRNLTIVFVLFKAVMTVLPELSVLSESSTDEISYANSLYRYLGVMRGFCFIPVLFFGIVWLFKMVKYFKRISTDTSLNSALEEVYSNKEEKHTSIFVKSYIKSASWFMIVGALVTLDIRIEKINMLPDALLLLLFIPALFYFSKVIKTKAIGIKIFMLLYAFSSIASHLLEAYYIENYTYNAMNKDTVAFALYFVSVIFVALQGAMFICLLSAFFKLIKNVISSHTGYVVGRESSSLGEDKRIAEVHKELNKNFIYAIDLAMLYVLSDVLYALYGAFYAFANVNLGFLNVVNLVCGLLFVGVLIKAFHEMQDAVSIKYMLE